MRFGSVCSGIEAASVALEPLGYEAAWLAEIEPFPSAVLAHHYPDVPNHGDMTALPAAVLSGKVEAPEVLIGGTPCQAFSVAGMRRGMVDPRGLLTIRFVELADAIDLVRTRRGDDAGIVWWENVPGVLSDKENAFGCFLAALVGESEPLQPPGGKWSNAGCVYGPRRSAAWRILDAQYFGLAQRRRRVFVVASARDGFDPAEVLFEREGLRRDFAPSRKPGEEVTPTIRAGAPNSGAGHGARSGDSKDELIVPVFSSTGEVAHGLNAGGMGRQDYETETMIAHTLRGEGFDASEDGTGRGTPLVPVSVALRGRDGGATAELGDECAFTLRASSGGGDKPHVMAPVAFAHQAGGIQTTLGYDPESGTSPTLSANQTPAIAYDMQNDAIGGDVASTLQAEAQRSGNRCAGVMQGMSVRRLTPVECERLQGFPDGYTDIRPKGKDTPDGPRYKALGNSMAVPVMAWIGQRIQNVVARRQRIAA